MTVSYLILNDLLNDVQRPNASTSELDGVFFRIFKEIARPSEGTALREQQDNAIMHHKVLAAVAVHPNWDASGSVHKSLLYALHMPTDENGVWNQTTRNAVADIMRLLPTEVLLRTVEVEHALLTQHGLAALPVVVKARLNTNVSMDTAPNASHKLI